MEEYWEPIPGFDPYLVSTLGRVRNEEREAMMALTKNQQGITVVTMRHDGRTHIRSVAKLVANVFIPGADHIFNTPIHLNGVRDDCSAENLTWRPLWFAREYHAQFRKAIWNRYSRRIICHQTGEEWFSLIEACKTHGLLCQEVVNGMDGSRPIFPTRQTFAWA